MTTYNADMQQRRDTAANWTSNDPTLKAGEWGFETDTGKVKIGDGATAWTSLAYLEDAMDPSTALASAVWGDLSDVDMTTAAPTTGQFAEWDGAKWVPTDIDGGSA